MVIGIIILMIGVNVSSSFARDADVKTMSSVGFDGNTLYVDGTGPGNYTSLDIVITNIDADTLSVLIGKGTGEFEYGDVITTGSGPFSVSTGDFNMDDILDLAVTNSDESSVHILIGDGFGGFSFQQQCSVLETPVDVVVGSFNDDEFTDLAVANYGDHNVSILLGDGSGGFEEHQDYLVDWGPMAIIAEDFDDDGNLDVATANYASSSISILLSDGTGGFEYHQDYSVGFYSTDIVAGDFNNDYFLDLAVVNTFDGIISILLGDGLGGFGTPDDYLLDEEYFPRQIVTNDFDGDENLDLAVTNQYAYSISILLGDGTGGFGEPETYNVGDNPVGIVSDDFNRDKIVDLAVVLLEEDAVAILIGDGDGNFGDETFLYSVGDSPFGIVVGEFNSNQPDLMCDGDLSWVDIPPGSTVTGSFTVENIGGSNSELDWEVESYPEWGTWTFDPDGGEDLLEGDSIIVDVEIVAPDEQEETFTGEVVLVNSEIPDDTCIIDVSLATPVNQQVINPLLQMILERFPNVFPILRNLLEAQY